MSRPSFVDALVLLAGVCLSQYLAYLAPLSVEVPEGVSSPALRHGLAFLAYPLRLTEGIVLVGPFFLVTQWILGRSRGLTAAEWLWVLSWLGLAACTSLVVWQALGGMPTFLLPHAGKPRLVWYFCFVPAIAVLAAFLTVLSVLAREPAPWTHPFALALMLWPALPLAAALAAGGTLR